MLTSAFPRFTVILLTALVTAAGISGKSLRDKKSFLEVLSENNISPKSISPLFKNREIHNYSYQDSDSLFCLVYYQPEEENTLGDSIFIVFKNKKKNILRHNGIPSTAMWSSLYNRNALLCGSLNGVQADMDYIYISTHLNPSSSGLIILTSELDYFDGFRMLGLQEARFHNGSRIYLNSQVHFSPWPHPVNLTVYDPESKSHKEIFPLKPFQSFRENHINKIRTIYENRGYVWFRENNYNANPEEGFDIIDFNSLVINRETGALAFIDNFNNIENLHPFWRLASGMNFNYFNTTRRDIESYGIKDDMGYFFYNSVYGTLFKLKQNEDHIPLWLDLIKDASYLPDLFIKTLEYEGTDEYSKKDWFLQIDERWGEPETWYLLYEYGLQQPENIKIPVVYFYKDVLAGDEIVYKEMLLEDFEMKYSSMTIEEFIHSKAYAEIFRE
ncbi:MAG: hypothetical protein H8D46_02380 [FCB group bacterium]|nr:hypothetical protein [FCB group bacterium]